MKVKIEQDHINAGESGYPSTCALALALRKLRGAYARLGAIGEPSAINPAILRKHIARIRKAGLRILAYTHFWHGKGKALRGQAMASCDTWSEVRRAHKLGWRSALHVPAAWLQAHGLQGKIQGIRFTLCPAQRKAKVVTCSDCGLCDATLDAVPLIIFSEHGPFTRNRKLVTIQL